VTSNQGSDRRPTKAERKEQARIEREEIQRRQASRSRNRTLMIVIGVVLAALVIGVVVWTGGDSGTPTPSSAAVTLPDPATLAGVIQDPPPWTNNLQETNTRLAELNLPSLSETILHHHIQLNIFIDGQPVTVPASIGYSPELQVFSPLHTHDDLGVVHVESADPNFQPVLGQFMDVWGVYFTPTCIASFCESGNEQLTVFVNGDEYTGDPTLLPLTDMLAVVITFGTKDQLPDPIPSAPPAI
jgi:hypothetical protein